MNEMSLKNLAKNMTLRQKVGIGLFMVISVLIVVFLTLVINTTQEDFAEEEETTSSMDSNVTIEEGVTGDNLNDDASDDVDVVETPVSIDYNEDHVYTLIDYIPKSNYRYITYGDNQYGVRGYWIINENTAVEKGIVVSVDSCDVEGNTASANEYLKNLPVDLSEYLIVYQEHTGDVPCDVQ